MTGVVIAADYFGADREEHPGFCVGGHFVVVALMAAVRIVLTLDGMSSHAASVVHHLSHVPVKPLLVVALTAGRHSLYPGVPAWYARMVVDYFSSTSRMADDAASVTRRSPAPVT